MQEISSGAPAAPAIAAPAAAGRKPQLAAFNIIERPGLEKPIWSRIGSAWVNRDGSFSLVLDSLPLGGKIHLREERMDSPRRGPLSRAAEAAEERA